MATFNKFNSFLEAVFEKKHDFSSDTTCTITVALCAAANAPVATNTQLSNLTQIAYTNLSARVVSVASSGQTSGTYKLVLNDLTLSASGGAVAAFRYVVLYDDDATNDELIGWYDYSTEITLNDGESLALDFDGTNGVFTAAFA
jgi:hypothetical protein